MAINSYADLKAAVADEFLNSQLAARVDLFLVSVEADIKRWLHPSVLQAFTPLVADSDTNAVLAQFPDVYRYGLLSRGFRFARDYEAAQIYEAQFQAELREVGVSDLAFPHGFHGRPSAPIHDGRRRWPRHAFTRAPGATLCSYEGCD